MKYTIVLAALLGMLTSTEVMALQIAGPHAPVPKAAANKIAHKKGKVTKKAVKGKHAKKGDDDESESEGDDKKDDEDDSESESSEGDDKEDAKDDSESDESESSESGSESEGDAAAEETPAAATPSPAAFLGTGDYFFARQTGRGPDGFKYERIPPPRFSGPGDDQLTKSMIMTYAAEAKDDDGVPTGKFMMGKAAAERAATEVCSTHKGMNKDDAAAYVKEFFPRTWDHFDVNGGGFIEVEKM
jgi:hypothetical protein